MGLRRCRRRRGRGGRSETKEFERREEETIARARVKHTRAHVYFKYTRVGVCMNAYNISIIRV